MSKLKEIEDLMARIESYKGIKACSDRSISALLGEIATIEAELAEEKKPKLKHGRCGVLSNGKPYITIGNGKDAVAHYEDGSSSPVGVFQNGNSITSTGAFASFEAFDEIKALQKPLIDFSVEPKNFTKNHESLTVHVGPTCDPKGYMGLFIAGKHVWFNADQWDDFTMKCRRAGVTFRKDTE